MPGISYLIARIVMAQGEPFQDFSWMRKVASINYVFLKTANMRIAQDAKVGDLRRRYLKVFFISHAPSLA